LPRLTVLEIYERQALAVMARVMAGETVAPEIQKAAFETLQTCRFRREQRKAALRKHAKRKAARAAAEAANADPVRQMEAEAKERIGKLWDEAQKL
jgi:hypothetical protein